MKQDLGSPLPSNKPTFTHTHTRDHFDFSCAWLYIYDLRTTLTHFKHMERYRQHKSILHFRDWLLARLPLRRILFYRGMPRFLKSTYHASARHRFRREWFFLVCARSVVRPCDFLPQRSDPDKNCVCVCVFVLFFHSGKLSNAITDACIKWVLSRINNLRGVCIIGLAQIFPIFEGCTEKNSID